MLKQAFWIVRILAGCALFALGFDLFLFPNGINDGGISGLAMILVELTGWGSVGLVTLLINIPLFLIGWRSIGRRFFIGSLVGAVALSAFMEVFELLPAVPAEPILASLYGGAICGVGLGMVFWSGASTGGTDIIARLLKKRWRNTPIGNILMGFDSAVVLLTGLVFWNFSCILYCGITLFVCSRVIDAVVYSFDYSKVALIISDQYEEIAAAIERELDRGATFLQGEGVYTKKETKVVLTALKRYQLSELKELVTGIDPDAFVILQDSHQVLGEGFSRYSDNSL